MLIVKFAICGTKTIWILDEDWATVAQILKYSGAIMAFLGLGFKKY
jgi:hypothetical protein